MVFDVMSLFDLIINIFEGFILSGFLAYFFELENKWKYITCMTTIVTIEIILSNSVNKYDWLLIFITIITLFIGLIIEKRQIFVSFFMCIIINVILLCCNGIALFLTSLIFDVSIYELTMSQNSNVFNIAIIISKLLLTLVLIYMCRNKLSTNNTLKFKTWWMYVIIIFILLLLSIIVLEVIMLQRFKLFTMFSALSLIILSIILVVLLFYRTNDANEQLIRVTTKINDNKNKEKNFELISIINREMEDTLHNSKYFLLLLKKELQNNNYQKMMDMVNDRLDEILKLQTLIKTGNLLFDYNCNYKLKKYNLKSKNIKFMISLDKVEFFDNSIFIDFINELLSSMSFDSKNNYISFDIQNTKQFVMIRIVLKKDADLQLFWSEKLTQLKRILSYEYDIKQYDEFISVSIIMPIN